MRGGQQASTTSNIPPERKIPGSRWLLCIVASHAAMRRSRGGRCNCTTDAVRHDAVISSPHSLIKCNWYVKDAKLRNFSALRLKKLCEIAARRLLGLRTHTYLIAVRPAAEMAPNGGRQRSKRKRKPSESSDDPSSADVRDKRHKHDQGADAGGSAEQEERGERNGENLLLCEAFLILLKKQQPAPTP
jgi:hypothetical protein